ncbi:retron system putative HNH endonuclease [Sediminicoccus sp. KRV36]|uniref:retron system putative HNH endonuclease n=1 Tax=Sediminicoccus sp. KRV36 TaxID=3133721 RepID=UPI00200E3CB4|nr:retron system putative HNH endonuclease [Sediminicoccus rosea]UPY35032.1 TIGR02646 family protein [Sediminicoccus rosea]
MRQISKGAEPAALIAWKAENRALPTYRYASLSADHRLALRAALVAEQRGLCAYTGRRIDPDSCHIEHLRPQAHCENGEDVDYRNLVAGVPAPNTPQLPYGAHKKADWPANAQEHLFVSPLSGGCAARFSFKLNGEVEPASATDTAATETIARLGLNADALVRLRKAAIDATLQIRGRGPASIGIADARKRLRTLHRAEQQAGILEPYSFALVQALERHIRRIEKIRKARGQP